VHKCYDSKRKRHTRSLLGPLLVFMLALAKFWGAHLFAAVGVALADEAQGKGAPSAPDSQQTSPASADPQSKSSAPASEREEPPPIMRASRRNLNRRPLKNQRINRPPVRRPNRAPNLPLLARNLPLLPLLVRSLPPLSSQPPSRFPNRAPS
jgi:hypothetical protein